MSKDPEDTKLTAVLAKAGKYQRAGENLKRTIQEISTLTAERTRVENLFRRYCASAGINPDDYPTWEEVGKAVDAFIANANNAKGIVETYAERGATLDACAFAPGMHVEMAACFIADARDLDVVPEDYSTFKSMGEAMDVASPVNED